MIVNYILTAMRNFKKRPLFSIINILGLSLGLGLFILILCYVRFEHSYDKFQQNYNDIYRVELDLDGKGRNVAFSQPAVRDYLKTQYPEVIKAVSFYNTGGQSFQIEQQMPLDETQGWWADSGFLQFFTFPLFQGDIETALKDPFSIVISRDLAEKYFPDTDPMGHTIRINNENDYKVTGIIENCPANSHIQYNYLLSFSTYLSTHSPDYFETWRSWQYNYVQLHTETDIDLFNTKIRDMLRTTINESYPCNVYVKPMHEFHFQSNVIGEIGQSGDLSRVRLYTVIGLFILIIACINFMNLTTAQSSKRMKEVGLRKTLGAGRKEMIKQFLGESMFMAIMAMLLGLLWTTLGLGPMNQFMAREIPYTTLFSTLNLLQILGIGLLTGLLAGSYPAFVMSAFMPAVILRGTARSQSGSARIRKTLVVFQFVISMILILGTLTIHKQMHYMHDKDLGIQYSTVLVADFHASDQITQNRYQVLKNKWGALPGVDRVSYSLFSPGFNGASAVLTNWEGSTANQNMYIYVNRIDADFLDTYDISLVEGRNFNADRSADATTCIINETAAKAFGWDVPIGKRIGDQIEVIGVFKDFHFASFKEAIAPMWIRPLQPSQGTTRGANTISIKLNGNLTESRVAVSKAFSEVFPTETFDSEFFDEFIEFRYNTEKTTAKTIGFFTGLAIFIACLGLFGLSTFTAEQRIKEIGIRKVLGATVPQLIQLLLMSFGKWISIASVLAWPIGYWAMNKWLATYHYHTQISIDLFIITTLAALLIGIMTVIAQAVKAALANPVQSLKCE